MKKSLIALSLSTIVLAGCKKEPYIVSSELIVEQTFQVKDDNKKIVDLEAGTYEASLNINTSRVKAIVKTADKKNTTFRLLLPKGTKFPTNGTIELSSAQSGQPFNTLVNVSTRVQDGSRRVEFEDCLRDGYRECIVTGNPPTTVCSGNGGGFGRRHVEYFVRTYNREILATMTHASGALARAAGSRADSERIYTYTGRCF